MGEVLGEVGRMALSQLACQSAAPGSGDGPTWGVGAQNIRLRGAIRVPLAVPWAPRVAGHCITWGWGHLRMHSQQNCVGHGNAAGGWVLDRCGLPCRTPTWIYSCKPP